MQVVMTRSILTLLLQISILLIFTLQTCFIFSTTTIPQNQVYHNNNLLLPKDIHNDPSIKKALRILRFLGTTTSSSTDSDTTTTTRREYDDTDETRKKQRDYALDLLISSKVYKPNHGITLTLVGYKGGKVQDQINQDRALVVSPLLTQGDGGNEGAKMDSDTNNNNDDDDDDEDSGGNEEWIDSYPMVQLMGVFDGHGEEGELVSEYVTKELPSFLSRHLMQHTAITTQQQQEDNEHPQDEETSIKELLINSFLHVNATIPITEGKRQQGGCTASILLRIHNKLYMANVGDSQTFLFSYQKSTSTFSLLYETREDKPHLPEERQRIEQESVGKKWVRGSVYVPSQIDIDRYGDSSKVILNDKLRNLQYSLAMSRSIGDWAFSSVGVIATPIVDSLDLNQVILELQEQQQRQLEDVCKEGDTDQSCQLPSNDFHVFAVSATDGCLDYIPPLEIAKIIGPSLYKEDDDDDNEEGAGGRRIPHVASAIEYLITKAAEGWNREFGSEYRDDIAISAMKII